MGKTIAQKIFESHLLEKPSAGVCILKTDTVLCHEVTTPFAITDLMERKKDSVFDPEKIKVVIDHVSPAKDTKTAVQGKILRDWALRNNIKDFFDIGQNGVCHALFPEKGFIRPGTVVIMGDSHTCTHGAFGAFAAGVGTTDLEVGILKGVCAFKEPETIKLTLTGTLKKGVFAKDVILYIISKLGVNGATDKIIEFTGNVINSFSMEERMTVCNMAVEAGATSGICMPDQKTVDYLWPFINKEFSSKEEALKEYSKFCDDSDAVYSQEITIDVSTLTPLSTYGNKPDLVKKVSDMAKTKIDQVYIGGCTNGRISDLRIASQVFKDQTVAKGVRAIVSPATPLVYAQALEEGLISIFIKSGVCVTNPTCGACLGMSNGVLAPGEVCASTTNRNFNGRMGKGGTVHLVSPATAAASAISGYLTNSSLFEG